MASQQTPTASSAEEAQSAGTGLPALRHGLARYFRPFVIDRVLRRRPIGAPMPRRIVDVEPIDRLACGLADEAMGRIADALERSEVGADRAPAGGADLSSLIETVVAEVEHDFVVADADGSRDSGVYHRAFGKAAA